MRRFFKSAAFPILLVVILAFIAQRVITSDSGSKSPSYNQIVNEKDGLIAEGKVEEVSVNVKDSTLDIKTKEENGESGESFSTGYPPNDEQHLMRLLEKSEVPKTVVHGTGSSGLLSLLTKPERLRVDLSPRYIGFEIPNRFAIGYGLDHAQRYRNLDYVAALGQ